MSKTSNGLGNGEDGLPVIYWHYGPEGGLEFILAEDWEGRDEMFHPRENGLTWRWFSEAYPKYWKAILESHTVDPSADLRDQDPPPGLDETFDINMVPGFNEGDFPPWDASVWECPVPEWIQERYGERRSSVLNGPFIFFASDSRDAVFRALRKEGYRVLRRP